MILTNPSGRPSQQARLARGNMTSIVTTATTTQLGIPVLVARGSGTLCVVTQPAGHPPLQLHTRTTVREKIALHRRRWDGSEGSQRIKETLASEGVFFRPLTEDPDWGRGSCFYFCRLNLGRG